MTNYLSFGLLNQHYKQNLHCIYSKLKDSCRGLSWQSVVVKKIFSLTSKNDKILSIRHLNLIC